MKTKLNAWLSPYSGLTPEQLATGDEKVLADLFFSSYGEMGQGYTKVGTADVDVTLFDVATLINAKRQSLEAQLDKEITESHQRQELLRGQIKNLLALPNMRQVAA